jgi:hypothetical protein
LLLLSPTMYLLFLNLLTSVWTVFYLDWTYQN